MADVLTKKQRRYNMSKIKSVNTTPEIKLRKILVSNGLLGYRLHYSLAGKPDIVFLKKKIAIFIDGCFWHCCPICFIKPQTRKNFWSKKLTGNVKRDKKVNSTLATEGWTVLRFWEHEIKKNPEKCIENICSKLKRN